MRKKLTLESFIERANITHKNKYDYSKSEYVDSLTKLTIICNDESHGYFEFNQIPSSHIRKNGCPKCGKRHKYTNDEYISIAKSIYGNKYDYSETTYESSEKSIKVFCKKHKIFFYVNPSNHIGKRLNRCKKCGHESCGVKNSLGLLKFKEKANKLYNFKYDYSLIFESELNFHTKFKIDIICRIHGRFKVSADKHIYSNAECPKCSRRKTKESSGEKSIRIFLENSNIKFVKEKTFEKCKAKNLLRFDFYIPESNTCIEYDGKQHFDSIKYFGGEDGLKKINKHDQIKNIFCKENNINLIRIPYNKNINKLMTAVMISLKLKLERPLVAIDIETTGLSISKDKICSICVSKIFPDGNNETKYMLINPTIQINEKASAINGITNEMVKDSPKFNQISKSLFDFINGCDLLTYNGVNFDIPLLSEEFSRCGIYFPSENTKHIDSCTIYKKEHPYNLSFAYKKYLGEDLSDAHNALTDVEATRKLFEAMIEKHEHLKNMTIEELSEYSKFDKRIDLVGTILLDDDGDYIYGIGKSKGVKVKKDPSFCHWMLNQDFSHNTKSVIHRVLSEIENGKQ